MNDRLAASGPGAADAAAPMPIRVLVVDDSRVFCRALAREIEKDCRFKVIGTGRDGREAIELVRTLDPDVVTLDVEMPVMSGIEALRTIVRESTAAVIMLSSLTDSGAAVTLKALEIGAIDFIPKIDGHGMIHHKLEVAAAVRRRAQRRARSRQSSPGTAAAPPPSGATTPASPPRPGIGRHIRRDIQLGVIGSSTGGPNALTAVLRGLPEMLRIPIIIAQHMPPNFTEALARRLAECCPLRVVHAHDGQPLLPGTIYVAPGGSTARVLPNTLRITQGEAGLLYRPSVEILAASAAEAYGSRVLAVMLTGMGSDGARSFQTIRNLGGYTIAQEQASCVVWGMPRAVVELGAADEVLVPEEIGVRVGQLLG